MIKRTNKHMYKVMFILLLLTIMFFHIWQLGIIPGGLYQDETSIGWNAYLVGKTGHDEHGDLLPIYFKAFGEYKNPIYIYLAAITIKLFGASEFSLRLPSTIFFIIFLAGFLFLVRELFPKSRILLVYALLSAGFLPWYFPLSRIAFEVISQPAIWVWAIYFTYKAYASGSDSSQAVKSALCGGLLLGLSIYSYSTSRLLSFLALFSLLMFYWQNKYKKRDIYLFIGFVLASIFYLIYALYHPGALTARFKGLSYWSDAIPVIKKTLLFVKHYTSYWSFNFLVYSGDMNRRHNAGRGEIFLIVYLLSVVWIIFHMRNSWKENRFWGWLFFNFLLAPLGGALTKDSNPHALRSALMALYFLIIASASLMFLINNVPEHLKKFLLISVFVLLSLEIFYQMGHYFFGKYPRKAVDMFETYNLRRAIELCLEKHSEQIVISDQINYTAIEFYKVVFREYGHARILAGYTRLLNKGCLIYLGRDQEMLGKQHQVGNELDVGSGYIKAISYE